MQQISLWFSGLLLSGQSTKLLPAVLLLFAGVGVFIAGMNMLGDGLEKSAGEGLKKILGKISGNRFSGVAIGAGTTAIIQSSAATTIIAIGFVNAGIMTLFQATAIVMGANIGTTITGLLVAVQSLSGDISVGQVVAVFAFIGVMMTFVKKEKVQQIGNILCGLGLLFIGLDLVSSSLKNCQEIKDFFQNLFIKMDFPLLLILFGMLFTALIQSSSAATGLFIMMLGAGTLNMDSALFLVLGSNIGTCITAIIAAMGTSTNAKRTALIHLTFNVIGTILFTIFIWIFRSKVVQWLGLIPLNDEFRLALFHLVFNVTTTFILLPFIKQLCWFAEKVIPDKKEKDERKLKFVDERLLKTPPIAVMQVKKEVEYMSALARLNLEKAFAAEGAEGNVIKEIKETESIINFTNHALTRYLIKLSPLVDNANENAVGTYFHVLNDLERIGDHAENFGEIADEMGKKGLAFSESAQAELQGMKEKVLRMFEIASEAFDDGQSSRLSELTALENEVDELKRELTSRHYARLAEGNCKVELSPYFSSYVVGLERVADHLVNVGYSILNPTGSQSEAKKAVKA